MNLPYASQQRLKPRFFTFSAMILFAALPLLGKTAVDFDPGVDFSRYKTFAFVGGVENLVMLPVDREIINSRVHRAVARELTKKGLREALPYQSPDLVVRYWVNTPRQVNLAVMGNWAPYRAYIDSPWSWIYDQVTASSGKESTLVVDLLDRTTRNLAWRVFLTRKLTNADRDWNKADEDFAKAFESYPPSAQEKDAKLRERSEHGAKPGQP